MSEPSRRTPLIVRPETRKNATYGLLTAKTVEPNLAWHVNLRYQTTEVAMKSLAKQSVPVASAREVGRQPRNVSTCFKRILAPTDLTNHAKKAVMYAAHLARHFGAELYLLHIHQEPCAVAFAGKTYAYADRQNHRQLIAERLFDLENEIRAQYPRCTALLEYEGPPSREIVAAARELDAALIVISTRNRNWLERLVSGSDSEVIARNARCPVLVVRKD